MQVSMVQATHQLREQAREQGPGNMGPRLWGAPVRSKREKRMRHDIPVDIGG